MHRQIMSTAALAKTLGIARATLYYRSRMEQKDWELKCRMEALLREHPAYGSRSIRDAFGIGRQRARRVMRKYGIKPYRRRGRKHKKIKRISEHYPNLLKTTMPAYPHHIWVADFTELWWKHHWVYVATVMDLYTREILGVAVSLRKGAQLTGQALGNALMHYPHPTMFHSDNGREYDAHAFVGILNQCGIQISRIHPGCPWENGYQESFYGKFKIDLGDPARFRLLGELVAEIYKTIWTYNNTRIHSALKMPPKVFARQYQLAA
jgi:putative transposase